MYRQTPDRGHKYTGGSTEQPNGGAREPVTIGRVAKDMDDFPMKNGDNDTHQHRVAVRLNEMMYVEECCRDGAT